ncbi:MAG TPA: ABC transporter substrate-binding protein [Pseudolabrys sp.]|nr:ABC transporter substrate-binding protein [Pseudolabrys sp.]
MRRRELIGGVAASVVAWPLKAWPQQSNLPLVGMLNGQSAEGYSHLAEAVRLGLKDEGFVDGQNVKIEYRWAAGHDEQLPAMAVELVNRPVAVLLTGGSLWATVSAKAATATIPIVFTTASDPVKLGYVASLNRPGGNVTGVTFLGSQLAAKRLELAAQLGPKEVVIGFLGRPREPRYAADRKVIESAAASLGRKILFLDIADERELESAFTTAKREHVGVLIPMNDPFFNSNRIALVNLAARYSLPTIYESREPVADGGLMSYGTSIKGAYRQVGVYAGRILKGEKVTDLPVVQSTRFESVINLKTAKALGLTIPNNLLVAADEVIE